ncbi:MAG TPA: MiaB/RimO family radical SAM methylthiotransferase, partial [Candidatus Saccharimonadales bacterium]|nr:MiaB/RimO family radical SAM methylthiotransferase [Candidatus Saccharimonadales bacterium]
GEKSDAERIATFLEKYKIKPASSIDAADFVIFVTCGVRQSAEDRVYGQINNIKKKSPEKKAILTGCLAHRKDVQRRLKDKVDLYFPISDFQTFENWLIENYLEIGNWKLEIPAQKKYSQQCNSYLSIDPKHTNAFQAFVPVMTGCNNFCAYCVVPYARGREYSRPAEDILKEVKDLIGKGYKEIMLLGQNVNSYKSPKTNFPKLLHLIEKIPGNFWLTFLTSHPKDMSDELIGTIVKSKKICEYISLPAQSGDNEILLKMNRKYSVEHYKSLIKKIRAAYKKYQPDIFPSISTDIIVGFPSETKKQFENSAKLLREMKFDMAYIAQYSPRPETAAWRLKDSVSKKEKARREKVLTDILSKTALENNKKYVGKIVEVLVDKRITSSPQKYIAHTRTQKKVIFLYNKKITVGSFAKVKITKAKAFGLEGEIS